MRVVATFDEIFGEIAREVASKGMSREFLEAANAALKSRSLSESPVLVGLELGGMGASTPRGSCEAYTRGAARRSAASRSPRFGRRCRT